MPEAVHGVTTSAPPGATLVRWFLSATGVTTNLLPASATSRRVQWVTSNLLVLPVVRLLTSTVTLRVALSVVQVMWLDAATVTLCSLVVVDLLLVLKVLTAGAVGVKAVW